jgi:hypothetical protein
MESIGASVDEGPKENTMNGVQEWRIKTSGGTEVIVGVTKTALADNADVASVLGSGDFLERIKGAGDPKLFYLSSDLKLRELPIEDALGE